MGRPFGTYNMKSHNQVLGQLRTDAANRRNAFVLATLRALPDPIPLDLAALYAAVGAHRGKLPPTALVTLARQVRRERKAGNNSSSKTV